MPEKTKEELSNNINKVLGTAIDFTRLNKDDLISLHDALSKIETTLESSLPLLDRPLGEILDKKIFFNKPLRSTSLRDLLGFPKDKEGIFGFGILGNLLRRTGEKAEAEEKAIAP